MRGRRKEYLRHKEAARALVHARVAHFIAYGMLTPNRIAIRNQKTRWGSCSKQGNLNFHYKLVLLPLELADYVIVHELCHLHEFNHSARFWELVAALLPDYVQRKRELMRHALLLR